MVYLKYESIKMLKLEITKSEQFGFDNGLSKFFGSDLVKDVDLDFLWSLDIHDAEFFIFGIFGSV